MKLLRRISKEHHSRHLNRLSQEENLRLILDGKKYGTWNIHLEDDTFEVDENWERIVNLYLDTNSRTREFWQSRIHPDDKERVTSSLNMYINNECELYECEYRIKNLSDEYIWIHDRGRAIQRDKSEHPTHLTGVTTNINDRKLAQLESMQKDSMLRSLYSILSSENLEFPDQVQRLLRLGCEFLGMRCAIVSYVEGNRYTVLHVYTTSDKYQIEPGDVFDLGITYCKFTLEQRHPVGFAHAKKNSLISTHPSYQALKLEAYLGAPLLLNGETYGTLNFTSIEPREEEFTESEKYCVQLMAEWVSNKLQNQFIEKSRQETQKKLAMHLQHSPLATIEWTSNFRVKRWSKKATEILGWTEAQVMNKSPRDWPATNEDCRQYLIELANQLQSDPGDTFAFECDLLKLDGEQISTEWFVSNSTLNNKEFVVIQSLVLEVTERVRVQNELEKSTARYTDLYQNAPDMYFSLDGAGNILSANKNCHIVLGYKDGELVGKPFWNLISKDHVRRVRRHVEVAFVGEVEEFEMEVNILTKNNQTLKTHQRIRIIEAKKGLPRELRILCRDITEKNQSQLNRMLHLEKQRDEISREVQHRVKNSLQAVVGLLKMNLDAYPQLKSTLTTAIGQVDTIAIVNSLMMDSGQADIGLVKLLENLIRASSTLFGFEVRFENQLQSGEHFVINESEAISVSLILSELLINALKYHRCNSQGKDEVAIRLELSKVTEVSITISNSIENNSAFCNNGESTHVGKSMINALLPPEGARIESTDTPESYQTVLYIGLPVLKVEKLPQLVKDNRLAV